LNDIVERLRAVDLDYLWRDAIAEIEMLRSQNETFRGALNEGDGTYDANQDEINELRRALVQIGHAAPASNEELGFEWVRYAKRIIGHVARQAAQAM
jgi:hypothetical protein